MRTIFVVDDSAACLCVIEEALEEWYNVVTLSTAEKMFMIFEKVTPDLILLDIHMPETEGFATLRRLKVEYAEIPVILLAGLTDAATESHAFELGAYDFVTKPISVPILQNRVKNCIGVD